MRKSGYVKLLLSYGFEELVDDGDRDGTTPLMYAAAYGDHESALELLHAGADPCLLNSRNELYLDLALQYGNIHVIETIVKYYIEEGNPDIAQSTKDNALFCYVFTYETHLYPDIFRRLLELGSPKLHSEEGKMLFHAVISADMASVLLDFCAPPIDSRNRFGHTPFMVLSRFLDVDLVRKLLISGVPIHEQDHSGWTVLEHVFRANSEHYGIFCSHRCTGTKWIPTFQIAFELLQAGVNFGCSDSCTCRCGSQGCTALQFFLPSIHLLSGRRHNLCWIPWVIELFLLLRGLRKGELDKLINSLTRRQRFDELGLTHTCCLTEQSYLLSHTNHIPFYSDSFRQEHTEHKKNCGCSVKFGHEDLHEEQIELVDNLEGYCQAFEKSQETVPIDYEYSLIAMLARRTVFVERGLRQSELQKDIRRQKTVKSSRRSATKVSFTRKFYFMDIS